MITDIDEINLTGDQILISKRKCSLHQVIRKILSLISWANVSIISYSISDIALSNLALMKNDTSIQTLELIFDYSVKKNKFALCVFASKIADKMILSNTHIKLVIIRNHNSRIAVITSANLTENKRSELYHIITNYQTFDSCLEVYNTILSNSERFIYNG